MANLPPSKRKYFFYACKVEMSTGYTGVLDTNIPDIDNQEAPRVSLGTFESKKKYYHFINITIINRAYIKARVL